MKNLIGMTDFILHQDKLIHKCDNKAFAKSILKYANFLKQTLELWMFVPCDEDGNVLKEPHWMHRYNNGASPFMNMDEIRPCQNYKKAKERCLFAGFEVQNTKYWVEFYGGTRVYIPSNDLGNMVSIVFRESDPINKSIEDLIKYNLQLTPTAIKQLQS